MHSYIWLSTILIVLALLSPPRAQGQSQPTTVSIPPDHAGIIADEFSATGRAQLRVGLIRTNGENPTDATRWFDAVVSAYHACLQQIPERSVRVIAPPDTNPVFFASVTPQGLELLQQCPAVSTILSALVVPNRQTASSD